MKLKFISLTPIFLLIISHISSNDVNNHGFCNIDRVNIKIKYPNSTNNFKTIKRNLDINDNNNQQFQPIKIYVDKTYLEYQKNINPSYQSLYSMIIRGLDKCTFILNKLLKVKPLQNKINFIAKDDLINWNFNPNNVDSKIIIGGEGISADILILPKFSINEDINFEYIEGYPVYFDESNNRPIVGILNINSKISVYLQNIDYLIQSILLHQLTHILGFLVSLFKYYPGGEEKTIKYENEKRTNVQKGFIITSKVVSYAKKYFNCNLISGVELERSKEDIIADSHWEARILLGEYMNSELYTPEQVISEFTLALLEDSGWYQANYYTGGLMRFGKNQGCDFLNKDCYNFNSKELRNEFFEFLDAFQPSCSSGRQSRTYVMLQSSESFSLSQYNRNTKMVGKKSADYCRVSDLSKNEEVKMLYVGNCQRGGGYYGEEVYFNDYRNYNSGTFPEQLGESYSKNSFCTLTSVYPKGKNDEEINKFYEIYNDIIHSICYPMFCTNSSLTIQIYDHFVVCPRGGGKVEVGGDYTGYLFCPDYNLICTGSIMCNDMFDCVENESLLKENAYSYDYTNKTYQAISILQNEKVLIDYEKENDGKCPKFCCKCKKNKKCYQCAENMVLIGKYKNDLDPITCNKTSDITSHHYFDSTDNVHYECREGCESCEDENICLKCSKGYKKNTNSKCEELIENCDKYNNNYTQCLKCKNNSIFIDNDKSKCHKDINIENYYTEDGTIFFPCDNKIENCEKCLNSTYCLKCKKNYFFLEDNRKICYKEDDIEKDKYISKDDGLSYDLCSNILENCEECKNSTFCRKCEIGHSIVKDNNKKKEKCQKITNEDIDKYYIEIEEGRIIYHLCRNSIPNCNKCKNKEECENCEENYSFIGNSHKQCFNKSSLEKDEYYSEDNGISYYSCDTVIDNCEKCKNKTYCIKCKDNYFFIGKDRNKCYKEEEINKEEYYIEDNNTSYYKCNEVIENCNKCINKSYCIKCDNNYYIIGEEKDKCYNENIIDKKKYYLDKDNEGGINLILCNSILLNCDECLNKTFCQKCEDNYIFISNDRTKCINKKEIEEEKDKYYSEDNGINYNLCDLGIRNCEICKNKTYCIKCKEHYFFIGNDRTKCFKEEENEINIEEYYTEDNGTSYYKCDSIIDNCFKCINKNYCIECKNEYFLLDDKNDKCIQKKEIDDKKYYIDEFNKIIHLCNSTLSNCEECINKTFCQKCEKNYYILSNDHSKCINESEIIEDNKYYKDEKNHLYLPCNNAISNCIQCLNNTYCIKCDANYYLVAEDRTKCIKKNNEYVSDDNGISFYPCDYFIQNCEQCLNKSYCIKCKTNYFLLENYHEECYNSKTENENKYYTENEGISYNLCNNTIKGCEECNNSKSCEKCEKNYFFVDNDKRKCVKKEEINDKYFFDEDEENYYSCNNTIPNCDKCAGRNNCTKCNNNYYLIGEDKTKCVNNLDLKKYYTEDNGNTYYPCSQSINNCSECSSNNNCTKCEKGFFKIEGDINHCYNNIESIDNYYTKNNGTSFILCNSSINFCSKCDNEKICKECNSNFYLIKSKNSSQCKDKSTIEKEKEKNEYYSEDNGISYYSCDTVIDNCEKCKNKTYCIKCKDNYFFIGKDRNKCYKEEEINKEEYYIEDNNTSYYKCNEVIENCNKCINKSYCIKCDNNFYIIGDKKDKCHHENTINKNKYYLNEDDHTFFPCNKSIAFCDECESKKNCTKCIDNYFFIGNDRKTCHNEIENKKYYTEDNGKSYYLCNEVISHCKECSSKNKCDKCENNYYLSKDFLNCFSNNEISDFCKIIIKDISNSNKLDSSIIEESINSYLLDINTNNNNYIVHHLINNIHDYSILIFKSSICTYSLLKNGYYYLNTKNILDKLLEYNDNINDLIFFFLNYNDKNNLLIYNQIDKTNFEISEKCPQCIDTNFYINNNYSSILFDKFGNVVLNKIIINNIDIFNENEIIFKDSCKGFDISGIDLPLNLRIEEIFFGKEAKKIICKDNSCIINNKSLTYFIGTCQCPIRLNSLNFILSNDDFYKNENKLNSNSKIEDSFHIFTCFKEGFNKDSFKNNKGLNICLILILVQIIFFALYATFKNDYLFKNNNKNNNNISNPPKLIIYTDTIKEINKYKEIEDLYDVSELEQNNQSKDLNDSDYEEEIYIDDENMEKKKRNKINDLMMMEEEQNKEKKLKSEEKGKHNNFFIKSKLFKKTKKKGEEKSKISLQSINENNKKKNIDINEKKVKILIVNPTEQNLITDDNKITIAQMKTMEDFNVQPNKKKRSIKNISLVNKLIMNKKNFHSIHNFNTKLNTNFNNTNIFNQINVKNDEKNDKNKITLTSNDFENPLKIRDIILKNRFNKRDSLHSNKQLILEDTEEEKNAMKIRPKSSKNKKILRKNLSKESYKSFRNNINKNNEDKSSEHSLNNKSLNEKDKNIINIIKKKEKLKKNINISIFDYIPLGEAKNKDFRSFLNIYWNILSMRQELINIFSFITYLNITECYTPFQIKFIKLIFIILTNMFFNALTLSQNYFKNKFYFFNNKYNIIHIDFEKDISPGEKIRYAMNNSFPRIILIFIICLLIKSLVEYFLFCERKKIYHLLIKKGFNAIGCKSNDLIRKIKCKYYVFIGINFIFSILFFVYLTNFCGVYVSGIFDLIGAGLWTFILLQIFPFISSLALTFLRYFGLKKNINNFYSLSQILSF